MGWRRRKTQNRQLTIRGEPAGPRKAGIDQHERRIWADTDLNVTWPRISRGVAFKDFFCFLLLHVVVLRLVLLTFREVIDDCCMTASHQRQRNASHHRHRSHRFLHNLVSVIKSANLKCRCRPTTPGCSICFAAFGRTFAPNPNRRIFHPLHLRQNDSFISLCDGRYR